MWLCAPATNRSVCLFEEQVLYFYSLVHLAHTVSLDQSTMSDPNSPCYRYTILVLNCLLTFGSYFCFDMPSNLQVWDHPVKTDES